MDFVRVGYFIPLNGPLNGHPPSLYNTNYVCLSSIGGQTAGPIMTKFGTHMRIDLGMVPT